ncbi:MAG: Protein GltF [Pseudomonas sp.]|nr:MAG: Protein GltF [Pseudomonas sp.]
MNNRFKPLIACLLLTGSATVFAASSVDLTVTGLITPSACEPTLSNGGTVDYGKISAKDLRPDQPTFLPTQNLQLTVTCDAATLMALEAKDNREGSDYNNDLMEFGLGLVNGTEKLGAMTVRLLSPVADGVASRTIGSDDGGATWFVERYLMRNNILSVADASTVAPMPVQLLTSNFEVSPKIAPTSQLTLNNEVAIDGSVTVTVRYL